MERDNVRFIKGEDRSVLLRLGTGSTSQHFFLLNSRNLAKHRLCLGCCNGHAEKVFVGGIAASLMHERFIEEPRWRGIRFIKGLLGQRLLFPSNWTISRRSSIPTTNLHADRRFVPDYSILDQIAIVSGPRRLFRLCLTRLYQEVQFLRCTETRRRSARRRSSDVTRPRSGRSLYGEKKDLMLMDNNIVASGVQRDHC